MRPILMLRHGETDWNAAHRWQGWIDIPLNDKGRQQAGLRATQLRDDGARFAAIASSDLARAAETASIIAGVMAIDLHIQHAGFRERFGGDWQGLTHEEINATFPEALQQWRAGILAGPPNSELLDDMLARFDSALVELHHTAPDGPVLLVSHGGIQRAIAVRAGIDLDGVHDNLSGLWFTYDGTSIRAATHDETPIELHDSSTHSRQFAAE